MNVLQMRLPKERRKVDPVMGYSVGLFESGKEKIGDLVEVVKDQLEN